MALISTPGIRRKTLHCAIISDIHGNLSALEAVLEDAGAVDQIWCLGDVVGYGPEPNECIELLRARNALCLPGNHDHAALDQLDLADFNTEARRAVLWTRGQLTPENRDFLRALAERRVEGDFTCVHASPRHPIWEYVVSVAIARVNFAHFTTRACFHGHTHVPIVFQLKADTSCQALLPSVEYPLRLGDAPGSRWMINPGSVGQPRDGDRRASYAILDTDQNLVEYRRVLYPIEETQRKMQQHNLPPRLITRLSYGW